MTPDLPAAIRVPDLPGAARTRPEKSATGRSTSLPTPYGTQRPAPERRREDRKDD